MTLPARLQLDQERRAARTAPGRDALMASGGDGTCLGNAAQKGSPDPGTPTDEVVTGPNSISVPPELAQSILIVDPKSGASVTDPTTDTIPQRLERYTRYREQALSQSRYLQQMDPRSEAAGLFDVGHIADSLRLCGSYLVFRDYCGIGETRLAAARFCQHGRLCAFCAMRRLVRKVQRCVPIAYQAVKDTRARAYLVTLTVKNGEDLQERLDHLRDCERRLHERGKRYRDFLQGKRRKGERYTEWHKVIGQLWSVEIKRGRYSGGWHPHQHSLCLCADEIDQQALAAEWHELTGDSFVVDVRPLHAQSAIDQGAALEEVQHQLALDLFEVISYALKFSSMHPSETWHAYKATYGKQLSRTRGALYACNARDEYLDEPLSVEDEPYVERVARWVFDHYELEVNR